MKKLYFTLAAALLGVASLQARELTFYNGDEKIASGEEVTFNEVEKEAIGGGAFEVKIAPKLFLGSDFTSNKIQITAKCTSGQKIQMCAGGACNMGETVVKNDIKVDANSKLPLEFEYLGELEADEVLPEIVTEFEAFDTRYEASTKVSFTLVMNSESGSLTVIKNNQAFRAVAGGIEYSLDAPAAVELYSITGLKVLSAHLDGSGILSTASLPKGIYIYTLGDKSGKLYIR